jgi:putative transposase
LSVRLVMQAALEAEISEFLGRDRYARGERERAGYRNGHAELTVKTTAGPVVLERPKLRGTAQPFASRLLGKGVSRTNALEALVISGFVRGLSTRDVEAALGEVLGPEAALSKSTVSRICQAIKDEFDAWTTRDLGGIELEYLFLDGSHFRMHPGAPAEPVLAAWGITTQGSPVLVITDGAPGLIGAVEVVFSQSLRQRCLVHRARNLLARVPTHTQAQVEAAFWQILDDIAADPGQLAVDEARRRAEAFADRVSRGWRGVVMTPAAVRLLQELRRQLHHPARLQEVVDQPVTPAAYHAPSGARVRPRSTTSGTPPLVRTPGPQPLSRSTRPRWTARRRFVLVADNLPTRGEADGCSIPAGDRLRRSGLAGPLLGCRVGICA